MSNDKDYFASGDGLFDDYQSRDLFDEEDEEIGVDYHDNMVETNPSSTPSIEGPQHFHISGKSFVISATKPIPESFKKTGVQRALLFLKNGKVVLLK